MQILIFICIKYGNTHDSSKYKNIVSYIFPLLIKSIKKIDKKNNSIENNIILYQFISCLIQLLQ